MDGMNSGLTPTPGPIPARPDAEAAAHAQASGRPAPVPAPTRLTGADATTRFEFTIPVDDPDLVGTGISLFEIVTSRDQSGGIAFASAFDPPSVVRSTTAFFLEVLRLAGHHHRTAHDEVRAGIVPPGACPTSWPHLVNVCDPSPECCCDILAAMQMLRPATLETPVAGIFEWVLQQFATDRERSELYVPAASAPQMMVLLDAAISLAEKRWGITRPEVIARTRQWVLQAHQVPR